MIEARDKIELLIVTTIVDFTKWLVGLARRHQIRDHYR
jgi:hypothetical protein